MGITAVAMLLPTVLAYVEQDFQSGQAFLQGSGLLAALTLILVIATRNQRREVTPFVQLMTLAAAYTVLPLLMALPYQQALGRASVPAAWFEMISAFTTTGASLFDRWVDVPRAAHLWRAEVAWLGGLFMWVVAIAVLAPLNLGGFEVRAPASSRQSSLARPDLLHRVDPLDRLRWYTYRLAPIYVGLTLALFLSLLAAGEDELVALIHAMSVVSTSGISFVGGLSGGYSGYAGEVIVLVFFAFALTRTSFSRNYLGDDRGLLSSDRELRVALLLVVGVTLAVFMRHWAVSQGDHSAWLASLWGIFFTAVSFLTTTGFESQSWGIGVRWSGLGSAGMVLVGLTIIGGGIATTAGGIKLFRVYALHQHLKQELQTLVQPSSVRGRGRQNRMIRQEGAYIAWVVVMLFSLSITVVMLSLAALGVSYEESLIFAIAALSNCGPLAHAGTDVGASYADIPALGQGILALAMIAGRLEALAIIALLNTEIWRR